MTNSADSELFAHRRFWLWLLLLTLIAWLIREYFVLVTEVEIPIRGDIRDYVAYAWNLLHHDTFSRAIPGDSVPLPDDFRGPGYPLFLAACMALSPSQDGWYFLALHAQALLGALTVTMTALLARHWLSPAWSLLAGGLLALWPHHIAATGALLSEVVFGFTLILALLLSALAVRSRHAFYAVSSGVVFSLAFLTNPISLFFPILVGLVMWRVKLPRAALAVLSISLLAPTLWSLRNAAVVEPTQQAGRASMNLVQGSWPTYHRAWGSRNVSPISDDIIRAISHEEHLVSTQPAKGFQVIRERMAQDPSYYLTWYLVEKPWLLWDWGIRIGLGDVYFHRLSNSPLERNAGLSATKQLFKKLNPVIFALSALASALLLVGWIRNREWAPPAAVLVAAFCIYVTVLHMVFQAEPRYSIPYRAMQLLMLVTALRVGTDMLKRQDLLMRLRPSQGRRLKAEPKLRTMYK